MAKSDIEEQIARTWGCKDKDTVRALTEPVTEDNCGAKLKLIRDLSGLSRKELAQALGCSQSTIVRLEGGETRASHSFMLRLMALVTIGHAKYANMNAKEKSELTAILSAGGVVTAGIGAAITAVSSAGATAGLTAAGVTSGLAAIGGGAMLGGLTVVAAIPLMAGAAGFGLARAIRAICVANKLRCKEVDSQYEIHPADQE